MSHDEAPDGAPDGSPDGAEAKLVRMANQIATFFATQPGTDQAQRVAAHLRDFWDPAMRARLAAADPGPMHPLVVQALRLPTLA